MEREKKALFCILQVEQDIARRGEEEDVGVQGKRGSSPLHLLVERRQPGSSSTSVLATPSSLGGDLLSPHDFSRWRVPVRQWR